MNLLDACNEYLGKGQQGQLVVKFVNDVHLCKILVADGEAVHIAHGRQTPVSILESLPIKIVEWVNFIAGYPIRKRLDLPLQKLLLQAARGHVEATRPLPTSSALNRPPEATKTRVLPVSSIKVTAAIDGFIEQIGPIGTILADNISNQLNYSTGQSMPQLIYVEFIAALGDEVPETAREKFLQQFSLQTP